MKKLKSILFVLAIVFTFGLALASCGNNDVIVNSKNMSEYITAEYTQGTNDTEKNELNYVLTVKLQNGYKAANEMTTSVRVTVSFGSGDNLETFTTTSFVVIAKGETQGTLDCKQAYKLVLQEDKTPSIDFALTAATGMVTK